MVFSCYLFLLWLYFGPTLVVGNSLHFMDSGCFESLTKVFRLTWVNWVTWVSVVHSVSGESAVFPRFSDSVGRSESLTRLIQEPTSPSRHEPNPLRDWCPLDAPCKLKIVVTGEFRGSALKLSSATSFAVTVQDVRADSRQRRITEVSQTHKVFMSSEMWSRQPSRLILVTRTASTTLRVCVCTPL